MPVIGLTGGIATGKSLVTDYLKHRGILVIDADELARAVVRKNQPAYQEIVAAFGPSILKKDGTLDRTRLASIVFDVPEQRKILEAIVHPPVYTEGWKQIHRLMADDPAALVVFSVPLLFETRHEGEVDITVVVYADEAAQVRRLMGRNGLSEEEARKRIAAQMPIEKKRDAADWVIDNRGETSETYRQVDQMLSQFLS